MCVQSADTSVAAAGPRAARRQPITKPASGGGGAAGLSLAGLQAALSTASPATAPGGGGGQEPGMTLSSDASGSFASGQVRLFP